MSVSSNLQIDSDGSSADPDETRDFIDNPVIAEILDQYLQDWPRACSQAVQ